MHSEGKQTGPNHGLPISGGEDQYPARDFNFNHSVLNPEAPCFIIPNIAPLIPDMSSPSLAVPPGGCPLPLFPSSSTEDDPEVLVRRAKQIEYGRNTADYDRYVKMVEKEDRAGWMPRTPDMSRKYSRRNWDGMIKDSDANWVYFSRPRST